MIRLRKAEISNAEIGFGTDYLLRCSNKVSKQESESSFLSNLG